MIIQKEIEFEILFFNVFRNIFLRKEITKQIKLYDKHCTKVYTKALEKFRYKDYIKRFTNVVLKNQINYNLFPELVAIELSDKFKGDFNSLPTTIKEIYFPNSFNKELPIKINEGIEVLSFGSKFNHVPKVNQFPNSLKRLLYSGTITSGFNSTIENGMLPICLTELDLGSVFNTQFEIGQLPETIKILRINGYNKQFKLNCLPLSLEELHCYSYDWPIGKECFEKNVHLKKLVFSRLDKPIESNALPVSITFLHFGMNFKQIINDEVLQNNNNIKHVIFGNSYNCSLLNCLPNSIEKMEFGYYFSSYISGFPSSLTSLKFGFKYFNGYGRVGQLKPLPNSLTELDLSECGISVNGSNNKITKFPNSLKICKLPKSYGTDAFTNQIEAEQLHLQNFSLFKSFPISLEYLQATRFFKWSDIQNLNQLKQLILIHCTDFNYQLTDTTLPKTLTKLEFGYHWNNGDASIKIGQLPNTIEYLKFGLKFQQVLDVDMLPYSLKHLIAPSSCLVKLRTLKIGFSLESTSFN